MIRSTSLLLCWVFVSGLLIPATAVPQQERRSGAAAKREQGAVRAQPRRPATLRRNLESVQQRRRAAERQLRQTRRAARAVVTDIAAVDQRLESLETALDATLTRLSQSRSEQEKLALRLRAAQQRMDLRREQVRQRLRTIYKRGDASFLSVLAGSKSVGDLASRQYVMERLAKQDREVFEDFIAARDDVQRSLARQKELTTRIDGLRRNQIAQQDDLEETKAEKREKLADLRSRQADLEKIVRQFESDERQIRAQIAALSRRPDVRNLPALTGRLLRPARGRISSGFGMRMHPVMRRPRMHEGIDIAAPTGTPVWAAADGVVVSTTYMRGYGNTLLIAHGSGLATLYGHLSRFHVSPGQRVKRGQLVARVGNTGMSTGPHLHFEVHVRGRPVNPMGWL